MSDWFVGSVALALSMAMLKAMDAEPIWLALGLLLTMFIVVFFLLLTLPSGVAA